MRLRTGIDVEVIDGSEENRLTYMAVRERLRDHAALVAGDALLVEVGGGSADISFLRRGEPIHSGTYALGLDPHAPEPGRPGTAATSRAMRLLRRHIHNVVDDIRREMPLREARHFIALGGDVRFAAERLLGERGRERRAARAARASRSWPSATRSPADDVEQLVEQLPPAAGGRRDAGARRCSPTASCCSRPRPTR